MAEAKSIEKTIPKAETNLGIAAILIHVQAKL
jgi:hypothetical protein